MRCILAGAAFVAAALACPPGQAQSAASAPAAGTVVVGSKRFTESYILGEIVRQNLQLAGIAAEHRQGLGNTGIVEQALRSGAIGLYPEYTGTIVRELLRREGQPTLGQLNEWLAPRGLRAAVPLGFNNTYALAMAESQAERLGIRRLSDLRKPEAASLRLGLSHEFMARADGWPALKAAYALPQTQTGGLDHGLAYDAVAAGRVDLIDIYSTDAKVGRYALRVLDDDLGFFPRYDAVLLLRADLDARVLAALQPLAGRIDERTMIALNAQAELDGLPFAEVARRFLDGTPAARGAATAPAARPGFMARLFADDFARLAWQHLMLVFVSLVAAVLVAVPLGIQAWRSPRLAGPILAVVGVLQTVPSLALLAFLIAAVGGIGVLPALLALFLYALLPIVRNTHAGLEAVPRGLTEAAIALGLTARQRLVGVQLPLALPTLQAGVKTAAVINVGTATLAAFVGAGGFGERIVAGLATSDRGLMLAGALPAAVFAVLVQWIFDRLERRITPPRDEPPGGRARGRDDR